MKCLLTFHFFLFFVTADAQNVLRGRILDQESKRAVPMATVSIYNVRDSALISYGLTTSEGDFILTDVPLSTPCRVIIFAAGHSLLRKNVQFFSSDNDELGHINLVRSKQTETPTNFEEPPVMVFSDSVVYTPSSFLMLPNTIRNSVLNLIPGLHLEKNGILTAGGEPIKRIRMDRASLGYFDLLQE